MEKVVFLIVLMTGHFNGTVTDDGYRLELKDG
jgi:hypothetical protein